MGHSQKMAIDKVEKSGFHDSSSIAGSTQQRAVPSWDGSLSSPAATVPVSKEKDPVSIPAEQSPGKSPVWMAAWPEGLWEGVGRECLMIPCLDHPNGRHRLCLLTNPPHVKAGN